MSAEPVATSVPSEGFNEPSRRVYRRIPWEVRRAIQSVHLRAFSWVLSLCPHARLTSSFRSPGYTYGIYRQRNQEPNLDSMHAWGALDFSRKSVDVALLKSQAGNQFLVVDEPKNECVHVEVIG